MTSSPSQCAPLSSLHCCCSVPLVSTLLLATRPPQQCQHLLGAPQVPSPTQPHNRTTGPFMLLLPENMLLSVQSLRKETKGVPPAPPVFSVCHQVGPFPLPSDSFSLPSSHCLNPDLCLPFPEPASSLSPVSGLAPYGFCVSLQPKAFSKIHIWGRLGGLVG